MEIRLKRRQLRKRTVIIVSGVAALATGASLLLVGSQMTVYGEERRKVDSTATAIVDSSEEGAPEARPADDQVPPRIGAPIDGISPEELNYARALVAESQDYAETLDVRGHKGAQFLESTVVANGDDGKRRLTLIYYDYAGQMSHSWVVNLSDAMVEDHLTSTELQPVPAAAEIDEAFLILLDSDYGPELKRQYEQVTGMPLTASTQTINRSRTYLPGPGELGSEKCAINRCVVILMKTANESIYLPTNNLAIDLVDRTIYSVK